MKIYKYFISFVAICVCELTCEESNGYGNFIYNTNKRIFATEDIKKTEKFIEETKGLKDVVILNISYLGEE
jgi:hypothetical protein